MRTTGSLHAANASAASGNGSQQAAAFHSSAACAGVVFPRSIGLFDSKTSFVARSNGKHAKPKPVVCQGKSKAIQPAFAHASPEALGCAVLCYSILCQLACKHLVKDGSSWSRLGMIERSSAGFRHLLNDMSSLLVRSMSKLLPGWTSCSGIICVRQPAS